MNDGLERQGNGENHKITEKIMRVGLGTDRHRLVPGRRLMLGGVHIPFECGEAGHSDGDALLHAVTDALLGASGSGDIGEMFPPGDARWKDADSAELLRTAWEKIKADGWILENLDCVVHLERPKLLPWREKIINSIAGILSLPPEDSTGRVFVKAKTAEGLGDVGEGRAVDAQVVCLLSKSVRHFQD